MHVYGDRLTARTAFALAHFRARHGVLCVDVIDPIAAVSPLWRTGLSALGLDVRETDFFAGHLRTPERESSGPHEAARTGAA